MSLVEDGAHWRARAKEMLAIADRIVDPESRRELIAIAEKYEMLANRADARASIQHLSRRA
jgi:hypothetical protein